MPTKNLDPGPKRFNKRHLSHYSLSPLWRKLPDPFPLLRNAERRVQPLPSTSAGGLPLSSSSSSTTTTTSCGWIAVVLLLLLYHDDYLLLVRVDCPVLPVRIKIMSSVCMNEYALHLHNGSPGCLIHHGNFLYFWVTYKQYFSVNAWGSKLFEYDSYVWHVCKVDMTVKDHIIMQSCLGASSSLW